MKAKRQPTLPMRHLGRVFQFTARDLAANRDGYLSRAQRWGLTPFWQRWFGWLLRGKSKTRRPIRSICGRAQLEYHQREIMSLYHVEINNYYFLTLEGETMRFPLTPEQYQAISRGVPYRVYYALDTNLILSLERALHGCFEEDNRR